MVSIPERIRSVFRNDASPGVPHEPDKAEIRSLLTDMYASTASDLGNIDSPTVYGGVAGEASSSVSFAAMKAAMELGGRKNAYLPAGIWTVSGVAAMGNILFEGPGELRGIYNRPTAQQSVHAWSGSDVTPAVHLPRFSSTASPVVVFIGDSTTTKFANSLGDNDTLEGMIRRALIQQNPHKSITFYNRAIGGTVWNSLGQSPNTGLSVGAQFTWYTNPATIWRDYIQALNPDLVICNFGMNETWNLNGPAMRTQISAMQLWTKKPDLLLVTNLTATTGDNTTFNPVIEQRGRDAAAGYTRTYARTLRLGILDMHRAEAIMVDGFDPCISKSKRVMQGAANTGLTGQSISLSTYTQNKGRSQTLWEADAADACRDFALELIVTSAPSNFWGDRPIDARTLWTASTSFAASAEVQWKGRLYSTAAGGTSGSTAPTHTSGSVSDGGVTWTAVDPIAPIFVRLGPLGAAGDYTDSSTDPTPVCGLLFWRDSSSGNIKWNIRDRRQADSLGNWDVLQLTDQDTGYTAPTSGTFGLRISVSNGHLHVAIRTDVSSSVETSVIESAMIAYAGGAFRPAIGYDGTAGGRTTSFGLIFDKGESHAVKPVLTADELWSAGTEATVTAWPYGGNSNNHPSSRVSLIYRYVLDHANLAGPGYMVDRALNAGYMGVGTINPKGQLHLSKATTPYSGAASLLVNYVAEGDAAAGYHVLTSNTGKGRVVFGDPDDKDRAALGWDHATDTVLIERGGAKINTRLLYDMQATSYATNADLTTAIPFDDTIPQSTEGTQVATVSHTAKKTTNRLCFEFSAQVVAGASGKQIIAALFDGVSADAIAATYIDAPTSGVAYQIVLRHEQAAGSTSARTYAVRVGANDTTAVRLNGTTAARRLGGAAKALLTVQEYE